MIGESEKKRVSTMEPLDTLERLTDAILSYIRKRSQFWTNNASIDNIS